MIDTKNPSVEFTALDRCDRCGSQALVSASKEGSTELLFCRHHFKEHSLALEMSGWSAAYDYVAIERLTDTQSADA